MRGSDRNTWTIDNFGSGEDLREGTFAQEQNRFRELLNVRTTTSRRLQRRPPAIKPAGTFATATSAGLIDIAGQLYAVAKKGTAPTFPTGVAGAVFFDNPDHCTDWTLLDATIYNGYLCALIRHTYPGGAVTSRIFLHVFDGKANKPTYVEDPFCPTNWAPTFPLHVYRTGTAGAFLDYNPRMWVAGGRLYISRPDKNVGRCKLGNPRAWNTRTVDEFQEFGEWYYFISTTTVGDQTFIVSDAHADLADYKKWAGFILEYLDNTGTWRECTEKSVLAGDKDYEITAETSRFGGPDEIGITLRWLTLGAGVILRFRLCLLPATTVEGFTWTVSDYAERFNGNGVTTVFTATAALGTHGAVYVNGALKVQGVDYNVTGTTPFQVTFGVAPGVGTANVVLAKKPRVTVTNPNKLLYQGVETGTRIPVDPAFVTNPITSAQGEVLHGVCPFDGYPSPIIADQSLLPWFLVLNGSNPLLLRGQLRLHTLWMVIAQASATSGTTPETLQKNEAYKYTTSQFFIERTLDYQLNQAGAGDAGYLPTAAQNRYGGQVTLLTGIKNRLLVAYAGGSELWQVASDPLLSERIDTSPLGTGEQTDPRGVLFEGIVMLPLAAGLWGVSLGTDLSDKMNTNHIGDPIQSAGVPILQAACYWPWLGCYVAAQATGGDFFFRVFDYSRENKVAAWAQWRVAGVTSVDPMTMVAINDRLYFRSGANLYYFDASVYLSPTPSFRDTNDAPGDGNAYRSRARWHFNDFKRPGLTKRFLSMDAVSRGLCYAKFRTVPYDDTQEVAGPQIDGTTYGQQRYGLSMTVQAAALILESTDESGWELERVGLEYRHMRR